MKGCEGCEVVDEALSELQMKVCGVDEKCYDAAEESSEV
jgi:hypothetical protein